MKQKLPAIVVFTALGRPTFAEAQKSALGSAETLAAMEGP